MPSEINKVRIVVDISGGAIHGVMAGQPVEIVFVSGDPDDLDDDQYQRGFLTPEGKRVALWMDGDDHGDHPDVVEHYFREYMKP